MKKFAISLIVFFSFFAAGLLTLKDYGISWDEPVHYQRGQAYLRYIITGQRDYKKLPLYDLKKAQIIKHTRVIGNAKLYRLNIENLFVRKMISLFDETIMPKRRLLN